MALTRFGYLVILAIIATAAAAIAFIAWPDDSDGDPGGSAVNTPVISASATPGAADDDLPDVDFDRVIQFVRLGAVASLEAEGQRVIVNFNPGFDTSGLGANTMRFESFLPAGQTIEQALSAADVPFNTEGGVDVIQR